MDTVHGITESQTQLSYFHLHFHGDLHLNAFSHSLISFLLTILWGAIDGSVIQMQLFNLINTSLVSLSACMNVCMYIYIYDFYLYFILHSILILHIDIYVYIVHLYIYVHII